MLKKMDGCLPISTTIVGAMHFNVLKTYAKDRGLTVFWNRSTDKEKETEKPAKKDVHCVGSSLLNRRQCQLVIINDYY